MERVQFKEVIEIFAHQVYPDIVVQNEIPRFNLLLDQDGLDLIKYVKDNPFDLHKYWTPDISDKDYELFLNKNNLDSKYPTIIVHDGYLFFELLTNIINKLLEVYDKRYKGDDGRIVANQLLSRIWLRIGIDDFNNVEAFLQRQLDFISDNTLDYFNKDIIDEFEGMKVICTNNLNQTYDESFRRMSFQIEDHDLAHINYEMRWENEKLICYIYAIQTNNNAKINKKIQRKLYKINAGINECDVHPNQILPLIYFVKIIDALGIHTIKIPTLQPFNYDYHVIMSQFEKERFSLAWPDALVKELDNPGNEVLKEEYQYELAFYEKTVDKEDTISKLRTEKLFALMERLMIHFPQIELINDLDIQDGTLIYKIKKSN